MAPLGTVGIADKGTYNASATYVKGNFVLYEGSSWIALKDNLTGIPPEEGENWKYLARGFGSDNLSQILGTDTSGVLGAAGASVNSQALIDAIADKVMTKLLLKTDVINQFLNDTSKAASAALAYSLNQSVNTLNSNLPNLIIAQSQTLTETTVPANGYADITYTPTPMSGYTPFLFVPVAGGGAAVGIMAVTSSLVRLRNFTSTNANASPVISVVYKRV